MILLDWPTAAFKVRSEDWRLVGRTISSGGVFGPGTVVHVENRIWSVTVDLVPLTGAEAQAVRAMLDELRGQFGVVRVPVLQASPQAVGLRRAGFDSRVYFDGAVQFGVETLDGVTVADAAPAGATLIRLSVSPELLRPGAMIGLPGDRVHRVHSPAGGWCRINPPLRAAVAAGAPVETARPMARMRLVEDGVGLRRGASGFTDPASIDLVEAF